MKKTIVVGVLVALGISGCGGESIDNQAAKATANNIEQASPAKDPHAGLNMSMPQQTASATSSSGSVVTGSSGKVASVQQAGNYTYVEVDTGSQKLWIAASRAEVAVGESVAWRDGAVMTNFHSKILNKTFPRVLFISSFVPLNTSSVNTGGVVVSVENSAGYSYIKLDTEKGKTWLAVPQAAISEGQRVVWNGGSEMKSFHSKSLNRTFDSIWFVSGISVTE